MSSQKISQKELVKEFFMNNPNRDIKHPEVVDWLTDAYKERTGKILRDPDRMIRSLSQEGFLIKIRKGVYRYDPDYVKKRKLSLFTEAQKLKIKQRDEYRCVICGRGERDGLELHVDHIQPVDKGGKAILVNGQTLCAEHNYRKKNYSQTETFKRGFIQLLELAREIDDIPIVNFCIDILDTYDKHGINGHIKWSKPKK